MGDGDENEENEEYEDDCGGFMTIDTIDENEDGDEDLMKTNMIMMIIIGNHFDDKNCNHCQ